MHGQRPTSLHRTKLRSLTGPERLAKVSASAVMKCNLIVQDFDINAPGNKPETIAAGDCNQLIGCRSAHRKCPPLSPRQTKSRTNHGWEAGTGLGFSAPLSLTSLISVCGFSPHKTVRSIFQDFQILIFVQQLATPWRAHWCLASSALVQIFVPNE
jgi:hypothetical protein